MLFYVKLSETSLWKLLISIQWKINFMYPHRNNSPSSQSSVLPLKISNMVSVNSSNHSSITKLKNQETTSKSTLESSLSWVGFERNRIVETLTEMTTYLKEILYYHHMALTMPSSGICQQQMSETILENTPVNTKSSQVQHRGFCFM